MGKIQDLQIKIDEKDLKIKNLLEIISNKDLMINDFFASTKESDLKITELRELSKKFFSFYSDFRTEIAILLGYEIAKFHCLSVEDLVVNVQPDKIIYTHLNNENFHYDFQDFKDIITYLVAQLKSDRNHKKINLSKSDKNQMKINLVSVDESGITVKETNIEDFQENLRKSLGEL